jgi:hypothetical protein
MPCPIRSAPRSSTADHASAGPTVSPACGTLRSPVEWVALTIDCADPKTLADFYANGLGADIKRRAEDSAWVVLDGLPLVLQAVEGYRAPTWPSQEVPQQAHFEIIVQDPDEAAARLVQRCHLLRPPRPGRSALHRHTRPRRTPLLPHQKQQGP